MHVCCLAQALALLYDFMLQLVSLILTFTPHSCLDWHQVHEVMSGVRDLRLPVLHLTRSGMSPEPDRYTGG